MAIKIQNHMGIVTSKDRSELGNGELQQATGYFYKNGDSSGIHTLPARSEFGDTGEGTIVKGCALCQFDESDDYVVAQAGTTLYGATPGASGTFSSLKSGLSSSASILARAHSEDRWYLGNGYDRNFVLEDDGTVRDMSMFSPVEKPVATPSNAVGDVDYPTAEIGSGDFTDEGNAWDADVETYAYAKLNAEGTATATWGAWAEDDTDANRKVYVVWGLGGAQHLRYGDAPDEDFGIGGTSRVGFRATVKIEYYDGMTWTDMVNRQFRNWTAQNEVQAAITVNTNVVQVRATITYAAGVLPASLRIYEIYIADGSAGSSFQMTTGVYYAITEYDETRALESASGEFSALVSNGGSDMRSASITLPSAAQNSTTTHFRIYRTTDGGSAPNGLGLVGSLDVSEAASSWIDVFPPGKDKDTLTYPLYPLLRMTAETGGTLYFSRDTPAPSFIHMNAFKASMVGVNLDEPRTLWYSAPARPESWPEIYVIAGFPLPEHDKLVATVTVGNTLLIAAEAAMLALDDLPYSARTLFDAAGGRPLAGQPGCVGSNAITAFSVRGEPRAAWVSPFGIHITNGYTAERITDDLDWNAMVNQATLSTAVLRWRKDHQILVFSYDSDGGGVNDRYVLLDMGDTKGGRPRITGPNHGDINDFASGTVSGTYRVYTAHTSNGKVYLEMDDATQEKTLKYPRVYNDNKDWECHRAFIMHTDGGGAELELTWNHGRDLSDNSTPNPPVKTVSMNGHRNTDFLVARSCMWAEPVFTYTGSGEFRIGPIVAESRTIGKAGRAVRL